MLSEQIRGIANHVIVGRLIDDKIIRLLYPLADEIEKLEDNLERIDGERVQFGDRVACLEAENEILTAIGEDKVILNEVCHAQEQEIKWMRREIERVGHALFTGTKTGQYVGTEEDLHAIGQFVEGVCENNERLFPENKALIEYIEMMDLQFEAMTEYMELLDKWFGYDSKHLSPTTTRRIGKARKKCYCLLEKNKRLQAERKLSEKGACTCGVCITIQIQKDEL